MERIETVMSRLMSRRTIWVSALLSTGLVAGAVVGLPEYIASQAEKAEQTCLDLTDDNRRCRFIGGPLEMEGQPVFMENFAQAFLPTKEKIEFVDARGDKWIAPRQTLTDGATIPPIFTVLVGDRQSREYVIAAALHDAYCGVGNEDLETYRTRSWEDVHRMFYEALLVNGTDPQTAKIMYAAVYLGGPRWDDPERDLSKIDKAVILQEMEWCFEWIMGDDPTPDEIELWMQEREEALKSGQVSVPDYFDKFDPRNL